MKEEGSGLSITKPRNRFYQVYQGKLWPQVRSPDTTWTALEMYGRNNKLGSSQRSGKSVRSMIDSELESLIMTLRASGLILSLHTNRLAPLTVVSTRRGEEA